MSKVGSAQLGLCGVAALLIGMAGWSFAQRNSEGREVATLLPASSVLYLSSDGLDGHEEAWEQTAAYQSLEASGLMDALRDGAEKLLEKADHGEDVLKLFDQLKQRGMSLAISAEANEQGPPSAWGLAVLPQGASLAKTATRFFNDINPDLEVTTQTIQDRKVSSLMIPDSPVEVAWWEEGPHLSIAFGMNAVESAIAVADGKRPDLTQHRLWQAADADNEIEIVKRGWFDFAALRDMFGDMPLPDHPETTVHTLAAALGVDTLDHISFQAGFKGESVWTNFDVVAPGERTGIMVLMDQPEMNLDDLAPIPLHNSGLMAFSADWGKIYETVLSVAREVGGLLDEDTDDTLDRYLAEFQDKTGIDPAELLGSLGSVNCLYSDQMNGFFGFGGVALTSVKDRDALTGVLQTISKQIAKESDGDVRIQHEETDGRDRYVVTIKDFPIFSPAFSVDEEWFIAGLSPQSVEAQLLRHEGRLDSWDIAADLSDALSELPESFTSLTVMDPSATYQVLVNLAPMIAAGAEMGMRESGQWDDDGPFPFSSITFPPAELVCAPLFMNVSMQTVDENGQHNVSRDSMPGFPVLGGGGTSVTTSAVLIGLLLPAIQQAREAARRTTSQNNLKQLALAMHIHADTFKTLPQGTIENDDLEPNERLSWIVSLLPFLDQQALYDSIDRDAAWDAESNARALGTQVPLLINPSQPITREGDYAVTNYVGIGGLGKEGPTEPVTSPKAGMFGYNRQTKLSDVRDGLSNTLMISDASDDFGPWGAGGKATIRSFTQKPYVNGPDGIGSPHAGGFQAAFGDGSVRFLSENIDPSVLEALSTINGREELGEF